MPARRKTVQELKASGTFRPSRHGQRELTEAPIPAGPVTSATVPVGLPPDVAAVRDELARLLGSRLTAADALQLDELAERVCEVKRLREASRSVPVGSMESARLARVLSGALVSLDRLADRFGLTPGSRTSLPAAPAEGGPRRW